MPTHRALLVLVILSLSSHALAAPQTGAEIQECVRNNLPDETSVQTLSFETRNRADEATSFRVKIYWKRVEKDRTNVLLRFETPPDRRGSALLMLQTEDGTDMYMYLPDLKRVRRVTGRMLEGSMFGTDFNYEEFARIQGLADDVMVERLDDDQELFGKAVYLLEHSPRPVEGSKGERVLSYIDPKTCVILRIEFFEGDEPRKVLEVDASSIHREGGIWVPKILTMKDVREGTKTRVVLDELEVGATIPRKVFSKSGMARGN